MKLPLTATLLFAGALALALQGKALYISPDESFVIRNTTHSSAHTDEDTHLAFEGTGTPVIIERKDRGLTMSANHLSGHAVPQGNSAYLLDGQFAGSAQMLQDTQSQDAFLKAHNLPPIKHTGDSRTQLDTERFDYKGDPTEGTVTIPGAIVMTMHMVGTHDVKRKVKGVDVTGPETYDQNNTLNAASGTITLDPRPSTVPENQLKKGELTGPVKLHMVRGAKGPGDEKVVITTMDLSADKMSFDFTGAKRTITITGNVVVTGDNGAFAGTMNADQAVIVVDDNFRIKSTDTTGSPTVTNLRKVGGGR
jgi:hypothetical protein